MTISHNHLRAFRKRSHLLQSDIAFLLEMKDNSNITRYEQGERPPNLNILLTYHLIFDSPVDTFLLPQKVKVFRKLIVRICELIADIEMEKPTAKNKHRIAFLKEVLSRLSSDRSV